MPDPEDQDKADKSHPLEQVTGERDVPPEEDRTRQGDGEQSQQEEDGDD